jgi:hypothetical protein
MESFWIIFAICGLSGGVVLLVLMSDTSAVMTDEPATLDTQNHIGDSRPTR